MFSNRVGTWFGALTGLAFSVQSIVIRSCFSCVIFPCFCIVKDFTPKWFGAPTVIQQGSPENRWDHRNADLSTPRPLGFQRGVFYKSKEKREKIMRIGNLCVFGLCVFMVGTAYAETTSTDRKTVSSKAYVDTSVETRQEKIPAAGTNSANAGTTVVMYTTTGNGTIGERGIYDNPANYTAGTDANKLVTASALKGSVTNLPTMETSKLTCANPDTCSLWTIEDQQVYGDENNNTSGN